MEAAIVAREIWRSGRFVGVPPGDAVANEGPGVFESLRVVGGHCGLLDLHLSRLHRSAGALGLPKPELDAEAILAALAERCALPDARGRIVLTADALIVELAPLPPTVERERRHGIELASASFDWEPAEHKVTSREPLERVERDMGGEVARVTPDGRVLESTRSNLFVLSDAGLETAAPPSVLPGVGRSVVLRSALEGGLRVRERAPRTEEASSWGEVFATNALRGVRPVTSLGPWRHAGPREIGEVTRRLQRALDIAMGTMSQAAPTPLR